MLYIQWRNRRKSDQDKNILLAHTKPILTNFKNMSMSDSLTKIKDFFLKHEQKIVLIVANDSYSANSFRVQYRGQYATFRLRPGAVGTYIWSSED